MLPPISIVLPTYNGAAFVAETLSSVLAQSFAPVEIIVVDDFSTDATPSIVSRCAERSKIPIRLVRLSRNSGTPTIPMNVGITAARTPLIALCDQDDIMPADRLQRQAAALSSQPTPCLACGRIVSMDGQGSLINEPNGRSPGPDREPNKTRIGASLFRIAGDVAHLSLLRGKWMAGGASSLCFPKQLWESVGGFDERIRIAWDYDFALKITSKHDIVYDDSPVCFQRKHDGNLSRLHELCALEMTAIQWNNYRSMDCGVTLSERKLQLADLSLALGWGYREHGNYLRSACSYLAHSWYGSPVRGTVGLLKLAAFWGLRLFRLRSAI